MNARVFLRRFLGVLLLLVTVGLATCQSLVNSFTASGAVSPRPPSEVLRN